ncbi:MAG TPA: YXWGXW repeat-containing protein [Usitatibacter sp.]|nr:YXWGXW repeat-containing protein [Usitatibacter sp.]
MDKNAMLFAGLALAAAVAAPAWSAEVTNATIIAPSVAPATPPGLVVVQVEPPAPRVEDMPPTRDGYVWAPGYWSWDGSNYVWVEGRYVPALAGYSYVAPRWEAVDGGWVLRSEQWVPGQSRTNPLGNATANPLRPSPGQ